MDIDNADNPQQAPKPAAPLDVDAALERLESLEYAASSPYSQQADQLEQPGLSDTDGADIDATITALESIHTQLTRDLHRAHA